MVIINTYLESNEKCDVVKVMTVYILRHQNSISVSVRTFALINPWELLDTVTLQHFAQLKAFYCKVAFALIVKLQL